MKQTTFCSDVRQKCCLHCLLLIQKLQWFCIWYLICTQYFQYWIYSQFQVIFMKLTVNFFVLFVQASGTSFLFINVMKYHCKKLDWTLEICLLHYNSDLKYANENFFKVFQIIQSHLNNICLNTDICKFSITCTDIVIICCACYYKIYRDFYFHLSETILEEFPYFFNNKVQFMRTILAAKWLW